MNLDFVTFFSGLDKVAQLLIQKGVDVNVADDSGGTALLWAAEKGKNSIYVLFSFELKQLQVNHRK